MMTRSISAIITIWLNRKEKRKKKKSFHMYSLFIIRIELIEFYTPFCLPLCVFVGINSLFDKIALIGKKLKSCFVVSSKMHCSHLQIYHSYSLDLILYILITFNILFFVFTNNLRLVNFTFNFICLVSGMRR